MTIIENITANKQAEVAATYSHEALRNGRCIESKRLRSCQARVYTISYNNKIVHILKSYGTIIACIVDNVGYDFLRQVYGYTATSAQHISKFMADYANVQTIYRGR